MHKRRLISLFAALHLLAAPSQSEENAPWFRIAATTTIMSDIVSQIAGSEMEIIAVIPEGADPHAYELRPKDIARLADCHVLFENGLEQALQQDAALSIKRVDVSRGLGLNHTDHNHDGRHDTDPHVWLDPHLVKQWASQIGSTLAGLDPQNAMIYADRVRAYHQELDALDAWIQQRFEKISESRRILFTDHNMLAYYAERYGLRIGGAMIPSASTLASPSAQEVASLVEKMKAAKAEAIFVTDAHESVLIDSIAKDAGLDVVRLRVGSLAESPPADNYISLMKELTKRITGAL